MRNHFNKQIRLVAAIAAAVLLAPMLGGCGKAAEKVTEKVIESNIPGGGSVDFDAKENTITIENQDGTVQAGDSVALPADFPKDIPVPDGVTWNLVQNIANGDTKGVTAQGMLDKTVAEVAAFMKKEAAANGWESKETFQQPDQMEMLTYNKGERTLSVTITKADDKTMLMIAGQ